MHSPGRMNPVRGAGPPRWRPGPHGLDRRPPQRSPSVTSLLVRHRRGATRLRRPLLHLWSGARPGAWMDVCRGDASTHTGWTAHMSTSGLPSYASGTSTVPLLGDTIGADLDRTAARVGDHEALVECATGRRYSYPQFVAEVDAVALGLDSLGVQKGDRVGIWAPNCAEWAFVQYGTAKLGAILVNINPAYRTHELSYVLKQAGISVLVSAPEFKTSDYRAMVAEVHGECPDLREVLFLGDPEWEQLLATGRAADPALLARREAELSADDPINIQYTSGTTGFPKGATLTHHNLLNNGFFVGEGCGYTDADRICIPVPYYHCFGMGMGNLAATSHGATMV